VEKCVREFGGPRGLESKLGVVSYQAIVSLSLVCPLTREPIPLSPYTFPPRNALPVTREAVNRVGHVVTLQSIHHGSDTPCPFRARSGRRFRGELEDGLCV
jgi:hypothetical protein